MNQVAPNTRTIWPSRLKANKDMSYESLDLLYKETPHGAFGDQLGFILSCSGKSILKNPDQRGMLHKLEVVTLPDLAQARMTVTHEVLPGLDSSAQIIPVNQELKVACFDRGCIIPISNFGYKKTFNSDVRGRLSHHTGQVCSLAANMLGTKVASGCTAGEITLYQVCREDIRFLARSSDTQCSFISAMSFLKSDSFGSSIDDSLLIYASDAGRICKMDTRCKIACVPESKSILESQPRVSFTSLVCPQGQSGPLIYLGGANGELVACDLRKSDTFLHNIKLDQDTGAITRMKEIVIQDGNQRKIFIAYGNSTSRIKILDLETMKSNERWLCDRLPEGIVRDLIQVDDRIVTCGDNVSIGCWYWDRRPNET